MPTSGPRLYRTRFGRRRSKWMTSERPVAATTAKRGNRYGGASPRFVLFSVHVHMNVRQLLRTEQEAWRVLNSQHSRGTRRGSAAFVVPIGERFVVILLPKVLLNHAV